MEKFSIELTAGEVQAMLQLIDLSVKAGGMQVAEAAVVLTNKIRQAAITAQQKELNGGRRDTVLGDNHNLGPAVRPD